MQHTLFGANFPVAHLKLNYVTFVFILNMQEPNGAKIRPRSKECCHHGNGYKTFAHLLHSLGRLTISFLFRAYLFHHQITNQAGTSHHKTSYFIRLHLHTQIKLNYEWNEARIQPLSWLHNPLMRSELLQDVLNQISWTLSF